MSRKCIIYEAEMYCLYFVCLKRGKTKNIFKKFG